MDVSIKLNDPKEEPDKEKSSSLTKFGYANLIGSLMYLVIATRPDIAYSVNKLAQYTSAPKNKHWTAVKRLFQYLKGSKLIYRGSPDLINNKINIYCDADWASNLDRKSISGYVITIAGGSSHMEFKKANNCCAIYTGIQIHHRSSCCKTSLMASITSSGIKFPTINTFNNFFGQSISDLNSAPSRISCTNKTY